MPETKCVIVKLPKSINNTSLRKLGEIKIGLLGKGNHTSYSSMWVKSVSLPFTIKAYDDVKIYTSASLTTPLTELVVSGNVNKQVFFTCATSGYFGILNGLNIPFSDFNPLIAQSSTLSPVINSDVTHFNFMNVIAMNLTGSLISGTINTNIENAAALTVPSNVSLKLLASTTLTNLTANASVQVGLTTNQIVALFPSLKQFYLSSVSMTGNISVFSASTLLIRLSLPSNTGLTIDIVSISTFALTAKYFDFSGISGITYTGTTTQFAGRLFEYLSINGTSLNSTVLSNLLIAISGATWQSGGTLNLKGDFANISAAAVTARSTIQGYGVTVTSTQG